MSQPSGQGSSKRGINCRYGELGTETSADDLCDRRGRKRVQGGGENRGVAARDDHSAALHRAADRRDLFERSPSGSVPTELGRSLIRSARVVLDDVKTLLNMGDPKTRPTAETSLVFASMPMLFTGTVVSELAAWIRCAEVRVQTYTAGSGVLDLVASGRADLAVSSGSRALTSAN